MVRRLRRHLLRAPVILAAANMIALPLVPAQASVEGSMTSYFNEMGAAANISGPSAFQGQSAGYYSLGNVYARFPQKNINPVSVALPGYRAGCGGIDIFAGSFSFINASEIVALLKAVANNAVGFAFKLAIDTLCPECGAVMADFAQKAQLMNNATINSCELGQGLVNTIAGRSDMADRNFCEAIGTFKGIFSDSAAAKHGCGSKGERETTNAAAESDKTLKDASPASPRNFTWHVLKSSPFFAPGGTLDRELAEYAMTLVGTLIYQPSKSDAAGAYTLQRGDLTIAQALLEGTSTGAPYKILKCDEPDKCLAPTEQTLNFDSAQALRPKVRALLTGMLAKIQVDEALDPDQRALLQVASLPLYKILTVQAAYSRGMPTDDRETLAEITSVDLMFAILDQLIAEVNKSRSTFIGADEAKLAQWSGQVNDARTALADRQANTQAKVSAVMQVIQRTAFIESVLQATLSPGMSASLDWSRGARPGALTN
jgi:conjugative transfer pilus assembly protein TraH